MIRIKSLTISPTLTARACRKNLSPTQIFPFGSSRPTPQKNPPPFIFRAAVVKSRSGPTNIYPLTLMEWVTSSSRAVILGSRRALFSVVATWVFHRATKAWPFKFIWRWTIGKRKKSHVAATYKSRQCETMSFTLSLKMQHLHLMSWLRHSHAD